MLVHRWWGCRLVRPPWRTVWRVLKTLKTQLPYDPEIPLLEIHPKKPKILIQKNMYTLLLTAALFTIAQIWKQPNCPSTDC